MDLDQVKAELLRLSDRVTHLEVQMRSTMLEILKGLKGPDDGTRQGLYDQMRSVMADVARIQLQMNSIAASLSEHEKDRQRVIGGGKTLWFIVSGSAGIGALLGWLLSSGGAK